MQVRDRLVTGTAEQREVGQMAATAEQREVGQMAAAARHFR